MSDDSTAGSSQYDEELFVKRADLEQRFRAQLRSRTHIVVSAAQGLGKSWLLSHMIATLRSEQAGAWIAGVDLAQVNAKIGVEGRDLFEVLAVAIERQLMGGGGELPADWRLDRYEAFGGMLAFAEHVERRIRRIADRNLYLFVDNADVLFGESVHDDLMGLLRGWIDDQGAPWNRLFIGLAVRSRPVDLVSRLRQSPFNVSETDTLRLRPFSASEVQQLGLCWGVSLTWPVADSLVEQLGGIPALTATVLQHYVACGELSPARPPTLSELMAILAAPLREHELWLQQHAGLRASLAALVSGHEPPRKEHCIALERRSLVEYEENLGWRLRAPLFQEWAARLLPPPQRGSGHRLLQVGAAIRPGAIYVQRSADQELPRLLKEHELCYVLATRQIGKTSLRIHTAQELVRSGVHCAAIDLETFLVTEAQDLSSDSRRSRHVTASRWYTSICYQLAKQLGIATQNLDDLQTEADELPVRRFDAFLREVVLREIAGDVVIFLDEIDAILQMPAIGGEFFHAIRSLYEARAYDPQLERLTFCLLGVASPSEITRETGASFNVGTAIVLDDFTSDEVRAFLPALSGLSFDPEQLLNEVFTWTSGHPYMTQRLCEALVRRDAAQVPLHVHVGELVEKVFLRSDGRLNDPNLAHAENRIMEYARRQPQEAEQLLRLYTNLLDGQSIPADHGDALQIELLLCGLAARYSPDGRQRLLRIRNPIFAQFFNKAWVDSQFSRRQLNEYLGPWLQSHRNPEQLPQGLALQRVLEIARVQPYLTIDESQLIVASLELGRAMIEQQKQALEVELEQVKKERHLIQRDHLELTVKLQLTQQALSSLERTRAEQAVTLERMYEDRWEKQRAIDELRQIFREQQQEYRKEHATVINERSKLEQEKKELIANRDLQVEAIQRLEAGLDEKERSQTTRFRVGIAILAGALLIGGAALYTSATRLERQRVAKSAELERIQAEIQRAENQRADASKQLLAEREELLARGKKAEQEMRAAIEGADAAERQRNRQARRVKAAAILMQIAESNSRLVESEIVIAKLGAQLESIREKESRLPGEVGLVLLKIRFPQLPGLNPLPVELPAELIQAAQKRGPDLEKKTTAFVSQQLEPLARRAKELQLQLDQAKATRQQLIEEATKQKANLDSINDELRRTGDADVDLKKFLALPAQQAWPTPPSPLPTTARIPPLRLGPAQ